MANSWWFITVLLYWQYKRVIERCTYRTKEVLKDKFKVLCQLLLVNIFIQQYSTVNVRTSFFL